MCESRKNTLRLMSMSGPLKIGGIVVVALVHIDILNIDRRLVGVDSACRSVRVGSVSIVGVAIRVGLDVVDQSSESFY